MNDDQTPIEDGGVVVPPVMPPVQQTVAYPRPQAAPADPNHDPMRFVIPVNPSGLAVAAGYLGLFAVTCVFAPIALVVGLLALRDLKNHPQKTGKGRAIFGLVMGIIGTVTMLVMVVLSIVQR
ncbi:MAG: DUF4190 domain-containing protein [Armatimonadetes bacterium]|nr:DUF4190 domain-containing protein [Armatimonadota bacterium]